MFLTHLLDGLGVIITMDVIKVTHPLLEQVLNSRGERILSPTLKRISSPIQVEVGKSTIIYKNLGSIGKERWKVGKKERFHTCPKIFQVFEDQYLDWDRLGYVVTCGSDVTEIAEIRVCNAWK